jgi:ADP-L-glycero-D-manno-heptose 6-epimerase
VQRQHAGAEIEFIPFPDALIGKYQTYTQADLGALRAAGYAGEFTSIDDGVAAYAAVLRDNEGFYRSRA